MNLSFFQDSQKDAQDVSQNTTSSNLRKAKSATGLINTKRISVQQSASKKDEGVNFTSKGNAKIAKMESTKAKAPLVTVKAPEQSSNSGERSITLTSGVESTNAENVPSFHAPRISHLSSNGVETEVTMEEQREKKPKVRFEAEPDHIDLSETQNVRESAGSCSGLLKENLQPEVRNCWELSKKNKGSLIRNHVIKHSLGQLTVKVIFTWLIDVGNRYMLVASFFISSVMLA